MNHIRLDVVVKFDFELCLFGDMTDAITSLYRKHLKRNFSVFQCYFLFIQHCACQYLINLFCEIDFMN